MKALSAAFFFALTAGFTSAEDLTEADREALLEKLEAIRSEADSKVDARFRTALAAFRSAMTSDSAAIDLYLKCEEMVNFDEMKRKSSDFRDWKRRSSGRLGDSSFKLALRYQLRWLVLTLEAASLDPDRDRLAKEAAKVVDSMVEQAEKLYPSKGVLDQSATSSVFARAYNIGNVEVKEWPLAPSHIGSIYERIILPPLRQPDRLAALKATWTKRIVQESKLADLWTGDPNEKKSSVRSPEYEKFVQDRLPAMQWEAEIDLFKAGDERGAAMRMLTHIQQNITHKEATKWAGDFKGLLQGRPASKTDGETNQDGEPNL